jgi:hypothetical protein
MIEIQSELDRVRDLGRRTFGAIETLARRRPRSEPPPAVSYLAVAVGAFALGAVAIGVLSIGRLAIGRMALRRARIGRLEVDELVVGKLHVREQQTDATAPAPPR